MTDNYLERIRAGDTSIFLRVAPKGMLRIDSRYSGTDRNGGSQSLDGQILINDIIDYLSSEYEYTEKKTGNPLGRGTYKTRDFEIEGGTIHVDLGYAHYKISARPQHPDIIRRIWQIVLSMSMQVRFGPQKLDVRHHVAIDWAGGNYVREP